MKYLSFILFLFLFLSISSCKYISTNIFSNDSELKAKHMQEMNDSTRKADSLRLIQEELISLENTKLDSARKEDENLKILNSRLKYKIIVGSFTNYQNARDLSEAYKSRGFRVDIIVAEDDSVEYVSVEAFDDQKKAMDRLKEFKATIEPKAWLYVAK